MPSSWVGACVASPGALAVSVVSLVLEDARLPKGLPTALLAIAGV